MLQKGRADRRTVVLIYIPSTGKIGTLLLTFLMHLILFAFAHFLLLVTVPPKRQNRGHTFSSNPESTDWWKVPTGIPIYSLFFPRTVFRYTGKCMILKRYTIPKAGRQHDWWKSANWWKMETILTHTDIIHNALGREGQAVGFGGKGICILFCIRYTYLCKYVYIYFIFIYKTRLGRQGKEGGVSCSTLHGTTNNWRRRRPFRKYPNTNRWKPFIYFDLTSFFFLTFSKINNFWVRNFSPQLATFVFHFYREEA